MKRFPKILAATCAAVALSSSLALAAEPAKKDAPAPAPVMGVPGPHGVHGGAGMAGPMMGMLSQLPPEKQAVALKLMDDSRKALYPMHQSLYAKYAELEALNAAGDGESSKAKGVIRDIADLNAKMLQENGKLRARMFKETGLRVPLMGHGMMGGMGMMGSGMMGGKGCGMMSGQGGMMGGQMGGMMGGGMMGGAPAAPAANATSHDGHTN
ncbi:MAG TPA: periplasmic heavy metal sensor [Humidesulfovibrio sp.]|uniref:periplasmic heavy metal sensor n=1 Tax=Humidesulfovibrio sp. TaxID=2910988 RepID=UPI002C870A12|nr:periplasmic heavy metal sensor [Humidesulfovibrio sp.]HWR02739.1 periplasmic heavy metal sensor [Humidesulfovibrio sp.]